MTMASTCRNCCQACKEWYRCHACCKCVPKWVCVTIESADCGTAHAMFNLDGGPSNPTYSGTIDCGLLSVDLTFTLEEVGGACFVFLESTCLGLTGGSRSSHGIGIGQCLTEGQSISFGASSGSGCGDDCGDLTITLSGSDVVESPIDCCDCLPKCLCALLAVGTDAGAGELCWNGAEWTGQVFICGVPATITATPVLGEYGACAISVNASFDGNEDDVTHALTDDDCSSGRLLFDESLSLTLGSASATLCLRSRQCACAPWPCMSPPPCSLHVSLTTDCGTYEFDLALDAPDCLDDAWVWSGNSSMECMVDIMGYPTCTSKGVSIVVTLTQGDCPSWGLQVLVGGVCQVDVSDVQVECDPFLIEFTEPILCECTDSMQVMITE